MKLVFSYSEIESSISGGANTLSPKYIGTNESGWTITGEVHEDYYTWVNEFLATHPDLGIVSGNFESDVYATSKTAYDDFIKHHPPEQWDYHDI